MYSNNKCAIRIGNKQTEFLTQDRGVRRGCPLSLTRFNIYINELSKTLEQSAAPGLLLNDSCPVVKHSLGMSTSVSECSASQLPCHHLILHCHQHIPRSGGEGKTLPILNRVYAVPFPVSPLCNSMLTSLSAKREH